MIFPVISAFWFFCAGIGLKEIALSFLEEFWDWESVRVRIVRGGV